MERYRKYQCATSLVGLKRVKAHFTVSHLLARIILRHQFTQIKFLDMKITLVMFSVLFLLCSCRYESQMIDSGNAIVKQIDSYIDSVGTVPMSLTDIGITIIDEGNPPFYYQRIDSVHYTLSFSNGVGESKIYYSDSQKWEDFPRTIGK